jgi:hypothetical protein
LDPIEVYAFFKEPPSYRVSERFLGLLGLAQIDQIWIRLRL